MTHPWVTHYFPVVKTLMVTLSSGSFVVGSNLGLFGFGNLVYNKLDITIHAAPESTRKFTRMPRILVVKHQHDDFASGNKTCHAC